MNKPHTTYASPQGEVVSLEELRQDALERAGGKGANLGELIAAGLDVPPGFCVTTVAYRRSVVEAGLALLDATGEDDIRRSVAEPHLKASTTSKGRTGAYVALVVGAVIGVAAWWRNRREAQKGSTHK